MSATRRAFLLGTTSLFGLLAAPRSEAFLFHGVSSGGGGGSPTQLTTLTLVNTGGSTQASGGFTPIFGLPFKQGDIPAAAVTTGTIASSGVTTLTVASGTGIAIGQVIAGGAGAIPANTTVANVSGTTVTMSQQSTGTISGASLIFSGAPQFKASGTVQPFSWGCQTYYPDGSLCWAMFMLRTTASIAGSGTLSVGVFNQGTCPAASARTLTEVYTQGVVVQTTGAGGLISGANLTGNWNAYVTNDANNNAQYLYMDGQAGRVWRIETEMAQTQGGAAHGQLYCYHYVQSLQDGSGNLTGFRYLGRICQPWYNYDVRAKNWRAFTGAPTVVWTGGGGGSASVSWPFTAASFPDSTSTIVFDGTGIANTWTATANTNWYVGADLGTNVIPGYITGSLDTNLNATQLYFAQTMHGGGAGDQYFGLVAAPATAMGGGIGAAGGGGTMTFNPLPVVMHFGSLFVASAAADYFFLPVTGGLAADSTIHVQQDPTYLHATQMVPPWDLSLVGSIPDTNATWASAYPTWTPISSGQIKQDIGGTGADSSIGLVTNYDSIYFFNQSSSGRQSGRSRALAGAFSGPAFRDKTTRQLVNLSSGSYTGMPSSTLTVSWPGNSSQASGPWTFPPANNTNYMWVEDNCSHKPCFTYLPCLMFGGPELIDLLIEQSNCSTLTGGPSGSYPQRNWTNGPLAPINNAIGGSGSPGVRATAWLMRDRMWAAQLAPSNHPDGSQISQYMVDNSNRDFNYNAALLSASVTNAYCAGIGLWFPIDSFSPTVINWSGGRGFMSNYMNLTICAGAGGRLQNASAQSLAQSIAQWGGYLMSSFNGTGIGAWHMYVEYDYSVGPPRTGGLDDGTAVTADQFYAIGTGGSLGGQITYSTAPYTTLPSTYFQVPSAALFYGWVLTAGDKIIMDDVGGGQPANFSTGTPYYVRDVATNGSNKAFNLAATVGGAAIVPSTSGTLPGDGALAGAGGPWIVASNPPAAATGFTASASSGPDVYLTNANLGWCWMKALFTAYSLAEPAGFSALRADAATRIAAAQSAFSWNYDSLPNWAGQASF